MALIERDTGFLTNLTKIAATFFDFRHTGRLDLLLTANLNNGQPILAGIINNDDIKDNQFFRVIVTAGSLSAPSYGVLMKVIQ